MESRDVVINSEKLYEMASEVVKYHVYANVGEFFEGAFDEEKLDCWSNLYDDETDEYREILEYWLVSEKLAFWLKRKGEPIYRGVRCWIWGRCCSGQAIALDTVIEDLAKLENQRWGQI